MYKTGVLFSENSNFDRAVKEYFRMYSYSRAEGVIERPPILKHL